ncbi:hypothetical protein [Pseudomonas sp. 9Ag]|uniref:hypothetical protein n=1 Tax=Pseudomonas sp. 9Ag TaxID=2653167 RepID=UPI0012F2FB35|nr:hypothetical protein [Pseudomonas sp. 9Ag]VXC99177.1 conserved hypothetical protein [Pseudomonas sp. 9Ag]
MLILITSQAAIHHNGHLNTNVIQALIGEQQRGNYVFVVSNHNKPDWFDECFRGTGVGYVQNEGRQNGNIVREIAGALKKPTYDVLVLAAKAEDIQMAKNGEAVLIAAGWSNDNQVRALGVRIDTPQEVRNVIDLTEGWDGHWWFEGQGQKYSVKALTDLSGYGRDDAQVVFSQKLTNTVKNGGHRLTALLIVCARSLLIDGVGGTGALFWAVYPSSKSRNDDTEVLSSFTHRLRTIVSRVQFARLSTPLFIRHTPSDKRSAGRGGNRCDPTGQITTMHLNPAYAKSIRGRNVIVVDDCTTYGLSFGVASALLRRAGANTVTGVALGKFGNTIQHFDIEILANPFQPLGPDDFRLINTSAMVGKTDSSAQAALRQLIR